MIVLPTRTLPGPSEGKRFLTIEAYLPEGDHTPVSYFRGTSVGVGGKHSFCPIARGEPVRAATLGEIRFLARRQIARMLELHPGAVIRVYRSRH